MATLYKFGFGIVVLLMVLLLFVVYRSDGKPDLTNWSTYVQAFAGESSLLPSSGEFPIAHIASTVFPNRDGHRMVLLWGEVQNTTTQAQSVAVSGMLLDRKGRTRGKFTAPAGVDFTPFEVFAMDDSAAVAAAYRKKIGDAGPGKIAPATESSFMLIFHDRPDVLADLTFHLSASICEQSLCGIAPGDEAPPPVPDPAITVEKKPARKRRSAVKKARKKSGTQGNTVRLKPVQAKPKTEARQK